jgi:hypothetical protein
VTPLAQKIARELTLPVKRRTFHNAEILSLFDADMHCFDVTAIAKPISDAMDEANVWPDVATMLDALFLPSPVTWLESIVGGTRIAYILTKQDVWWQIYMVIDGATLVGGLNAKFRPCSILTSPEMIEVIPLLGHQSPLEALLTGAPTAEPETSPANLLLERAYDRGLRDASDRGIGLYAKERVTRLQARKAFLDFEIGALEKDLSEKSGQIEMLQVAKTGIAFSVLAIDLINTPGLVGFRQHAPHVALAQQFARLGIGKYPLRSWSEVTVKTHTTACHGDYESGATFRKCLHFVRSHQRHYRSGHVSIIPAHWRGDPALGIKRTRYRVTA